MVYKYYNIIIYELVRELVRLSNIIYLDNSSTTEVCETAVKYINEALLSYGNPSSLHIMGMEAEDRLTRTRSAVAGILSCREDEVFFTGSGTEANNTAILGAVMARKKRGNRIITTTIEHPSVLRVFEHLENEGFDVVYLKPDENGVISIDELNTAVNERTILVSIMLVNNEIGSIQPVRAAREAIIKNNAPALLHTDAVQAFGKMKCSVKDLGVDLLSASGHKINGPKGVGILYKSKNAHILPLILGGGQEMGLRSGTESVPLISGLLGAIQELPPYEQFLSQMQNLSDYAKQKLLDLGFVKINSPKNALPSVLNISVPGYRSETLLHFLERKNIFVSSGSACAKGKGSYVLNEIGLSKSEIDSALRISFGRFNTLSDVDALCDALCEATKTLRGTK